jgi:hypothetical protein
MRASLTAGVLAVALLAGPAFAQTTAPPSGGATTAPRPPGTAPLGTAGAPAVAPRPPAPNPLTMEDVSKVKGVSVYGSDDKKIGDVSTALMKPETKALDRLVVTAGGVLGIGGHSVALPIDEFKWDGQMDAFKISMTAEDLKSMPEWKSASDTPRTLSGTSTPPAATAPSSNPPLPVKPATPLSPSGTSGTDTTKTTTD